MTNMTCKYVPKKSGTLTLGQFKTLLARFRRKMKEMGSDPDMRLYYVASCVLWFGLLRGKECFLIDIEDVKLDYSNRTIRVMVKKPTKTRKTGFSYVIPSEHFQEFADYKSELGKFSGRDRFLRYHSKTNNRGRKAGIALLRQMIDQIEDEFPELAGLLTNNLRSSRSSPFNTIIF